MKVTVFDLIKHLETLPQDYEIVIYPKYSSGKVDGHRKHKFRLDQVCEQEPRSAKLNGDELKAYFGGRTEYETYELNNHVAILF